MVYKQNWFCILIMNFIENYCNVSQHASACLNNCCNFLWKFNLNFIKISYKTFKFQKTNWKNVLLTKNYFADCVRKKNVVFVKNFIYWFFSGVVFEHNIFFINPISVFCVWWKALSDYMIIYFGDLQNCSVKNRL